MKQRVAWIDADGKTVTGVILNRGETQSVVAKDGEPPRFNRVMWNHDLTLIPEPEPPEPHEAGPFRRAWIGYGDGYYSCTANKTDVRIVKVETDDQDQTAVWHIGNESETEIDEFDETGIFDADSIEFLFPDWLDHDATRPRQLSEDDLRQNVESLAALGKCPADIAYTLRDQFEIVYPGAPQREVYHRIYQWLKL